MEYVREKTHFESTVQINVFSLPIHEDTRQEFKVKGDALQLLIESQFGTMICHCYNATFGETIATYVSG